MQAFVARSHVYTKSHPSSGISPCNEMASKRPKKGDDAFFGISAYQAGNRNTSPVTVVTQLLKIQTVDRSMRSFKHAILDHFHTVQFSILLFYLFIFITTWCVAPLSGS